MNLIETFQNWMAQVPELIQPLIVALAGAVPFIEGEGAASIGILGGLHPAVAIIAAILGNFACVVLVVLIGSGARQVAVTHHRNRTDASTSTALPSPRRAKFQRAFQRYGVPGVSLLGPLLLPTQFTAGMLVASGVGKSRVLFWQGLAIIIWTTVIALIINTVVTAVY